MCGMLLNFETVEGFSSLDNKCCDRAVFAIDLNSLGNSLAILHCSLIDILEAHPEYVEPT